jgi:hypothetical protein
MKKTAVLLDLGFVLYKLSESLGGRMPSADELDDFAQGCISSPEEELFRIYCYHCWPYGGTETHPITGNSQDFSAKPTYASNYKLLQEMSLKDKVAFRAGELSFDGWKVKRWSVPRILRTGRPLKRLV